MLERVELGARATQPDLFSSPVDQIHRHQTTLPAPVFRFDDEVGERLRDGIDDDSLQLPAGAVATRDVAANRELRWIGHEVPLRCASLQAVGAGVGGGRYASAHPVQIECENANGASIAAKAAGGVRNQSPSSRTRPHQVPSPASIGCGGRGRRSRSLSTTAAATSLSLRPLCWEWSRSISKARLAAIEWRAIRIPLACSIIARRPNAPAGSGTRR